MSQQKSGHLYGLDGLRAIAILGIVLYHMFPEIVPGGFLGVTLFFSIMGYLLVYSAKRDLASHRFSVGIYYVKKIRRLYPALILVMFATALLLIPLWPILSKGTFGENLSILLGYNNWWQISQNSSYFTRILNASPLTHLWYLGLTVQYYLIWPLLLIIGLFLRRYLSRTQIGVLLVVLAVISAVEMIVLYSPDVDPSRIYYGTDTRAFSLLFGMALALLPINRWARRLRDIPILALLLLGATLVITVVLYLTVHGESAATYRGLMLFSNLVFLLLMFLVLGWQKSIGVWLDCAPLKWIGERSYMIYLVMYPAIYFFGKYYPNAQDLSMQLLTLVVILVAAEGLWRLDRLFSWMDVSPFLPFTSRSYHPLALLLERVTLPALLSVILAIACLCVSFAQTRKFEASHDTEDLVQLEEELTANAELIENQTVEMLPTENGEAATAPGATGGETDPYPYDIPCDASKPEGLIPQTVTMTAIGDSVMLGAVAEMQTRIPAMYVDAAQSRQVVKAQEVASLLYQNGFLGKTVVIHLGTNAAFREDVGQALIDYLGPDRYIYWMTCYGPSLGYVDDVNATIRTLAEKNANVTVLEWANVAPYHSDWFYSDGIHLNGEGRAGYTRFLADELQIPEVTEQPAETPAEGTAETAPAEGTTEAAPAEGTTEAAPAEGTIEAAPAEGTTEAAPAQGNTGGTVPIVPQTITPPAATE